MFNLKKVDFIWINQDQKSFEWFINLLSQLENMSRKELREFIAAAGRAKGADADPV